MKKALATLLALGVLCGLCGCAGLEDLGLPPLPQVTEKPEPTPAVETPEPSVEPETVEEQIEEEEIPILAGRVSIRFETERYEHYDPAEGKELILDFSQTTPVIRIDGFDEAAEKINSVMAAYHEIYYTGGDDAGVARMGYHGFLEAAEDNYGYVVNSGRNDLTLTFSAKRSVELARVDGRMVNYLTRTQEYAGENRKSDELYTHVFDVETGELLTLEALAEDVYALKLKVSNDMINQVEVSEELQKKVDQKLIESRGGYTAAFMAIMRAGSWFFNDEGLVLFSRPGELGNMEAGSIRFDIPYSELGGLIRDKWMPRSSEGEGELKVSAMSEVEEGSVIFLDKLVAEEGEEVCLLVEGTVQDLIVSRAEYRERFLPTEYLWYCSSMSNEALQLEALPPEGMPALMISYTSGGERHTRLLTWSGQDGRPVLVDDSIDPLAS